MSTGEELDSRIERLETALREMDARLAKLEHRQDAARPRAPAEEAPELPRADGNALGLAGICSLILGGAFVLRALTESQMLPRFGGAILGLAYAGFWIWDADRLARANRRRAALFYAVTAAIIAFPLVWEATVRFHIVVPAIGSAVIGILGLLFMWAAIRSQDQVLAWTGSIAAVVAAFAVGPSAATLIAITAIGAATAIFAKQWEFAPWPAALASNIVALILIVTRPPAAVFALVCYCALWVACAIVYRKLRDLALAVQSTIALVVGIGGATFLIMPSAESLSLVWCGAGVVSAEVARRLSSRTIAIQSVVWIFASAVAGGLLLSTVSAEVLTPSAVATGITAFAAFVRLRDWRAEKIVLLTLFLCMVFTGVVSIFAPMLVNAALLRTALLAVLASLLAVVGRLLSNRESSILARVVLALGGLQLVVEDLRVGSAAILVIAFALYGAALMVVSRSGWGKSATV